MWPMHAPEHNPARSDADTALTTAVIDTGAIAANVGRTRAAAGAKRVMAVVKADGYGHGAVVTARAALKGGADQLGVVGLAEALQLRAAGITAPVLAWIWEAGHQDQLLRHAVAEGVDIGISSAGQLEAVTAAGRELGVRPRVTVKADTGMNRGGFSVMNGDLAAVADAVAAADAAGDIEVTGVMSHLACADEPGDPSVDIQAGRFRDAIDLLRGRGLALPVNHLANSAAALTRPDLSFDMIRPGIALYGVEPAPGIGREAGLTPAMTLTSRVQLVKDVPAGEAVSYGRTWVADRGTRVAVIPWGYADGCFRGLAGGLTAAIGGRRYRQVGRVCMDQFVIEVDEAVQVGDTAIIFGPGHHGEATAADLAEVAGTIGYEILTAPRGRVARRMT